MPVEIWSAIFISLKVSHSAYSHMYVRQHVYARDDVKNKPVECSAFWKVGG